MGPVEVCAELASHLSIPLTVRFTAQDTNISKATGQFILSTINHIYWFTCTIVAGHDYTSNNPQDVSIPAGSNKTCINYTIIDDDFAEELHERFEVILTIPNAAEARFVIITNSSSTVTIVDTDGENVCVCKDMSYK